MISLRLRPRGLMLFFVMAIGLGLVSCKETGIQGGVIESEFSGPDNIRAISPTSVEVSWSLSPRFEGYKIYRKGVNSPIGEETFAKYTIRELQPGNTYEFTVTGVRSTDKVEEGLDNFAPVTTFARFRGLEAEGVTVNSSSRIDLIWASNSTETTFNIYMKEASMSWDLSSPQYSIAGDERFSVTALSGGTEYCFYVVAAYEDGTMEPEMSSEAADLGSYCAVTDTDMTNLQQVSVANRTPGAYPWFISRGGDPNYSIQVYRASDDLHIASTLGNAAFKSFQPVDSGEYNYYALVSDGQGSQARVDVSIDNSGEKSRVRTLDGAEAYSPPLLANGNGIQQLGSKVVNGDFNCDGLMDVAVAAPVASPEVNALHYDQQGAVVVYYTYDAPPMLVGGSLVDPPPTLKTDVAPTASANFPDPQLVYYPVTGSDRRFGRDLAVGNINGDCFYDDGTTMVGGSCDSFFSTYEGTSDIEHIQSCDDLVVSNDNNQVFALFGNSSVGLVTGSGTLSYGSNELTCDPSSHSCRAVQLSESTAGEFGTALAVGDFNNDGFDDIGVSGTNATADAIVYMYRGGPLGIFPSTASQDFPDILSTSIGSGALIGGATFAAGVTEGFGEALSSVYNSRSCPKGDSNFRYRPDGPSLTEYGYDFGKCDDLAIGAPDRASGDGSIFICKAVLPNISGTPPDEQIIDSWTCIEQAPTELVGSGAAYGSSLVSSPNMNGYPLDNHIGAVYPNLAGSLFVGAPLAEVLSQTRAGKVYGYYVTPESNDHDLGGILGILGNAAGTHAIGAQNAVPCNAPNNNVTTGTLNHCEHQVLFNSPPQAYSQFGFSLSIIEDVQSTSRGIPSLVVSSPQRDIIGGGGVTLSDAGVVYVYRPDQSTFGTDTGLPVTATQSSTDTTTICTSGCTWYSGGVNPFGASVIYSDSLNEGALFGLGGAAGGDFDGDGTGDLIVGAPFVDTNVGQNGAFFIFNSEGSFSSVDNTPSSTITTNISNELNYNFQMAKIIGDINGDGYDDVMTQFAGASRTELVLYYGSAAGLITSPEPSTSPLNMAPLLLAHQNVTTFGSQFHRIGSVNGDAFDDVLVIAAGRSFVYHGSFNGLIVADPKVSPSGKNPLEFATNCGTECVNLNSTVAATASNYTETYMQNNQGVSFGDFNNDGFDDFAIGINRSFSYPTDQATALASLGLTGLDNSGNNGRVFVIYGGVNGIQTNRATGEIKVSSGGGSTTEDVVLQNPCTSGVNPTCQVQMLINPENLGEEFGFDLLAVPSLETQLGENWDELLVGDPATQSSDGRVFLYKGGNQGLQATPNQTLTPKYSNGGFGFAMTVVGDVNGDEYPDVAISAPYQVSSNPGHVYMFYGGVVESQGAFFGGDTLAGQDYWTGKLDLNEKYTVIESPLPQVFQPTGAVASDDFGFGLSAAGDFNGDGFDDVMVNFSGADYNNETLKTSVGKVVIYFGSRLGLQVDSVPSTSPICYPDLEPICGPFETFLPDSEDYEYSYITRSASGDINGDSVIDLIIGGVGRTHPTGQAFSVGTFYIIY